MELTKNFTLEELTASSVAKRMEIKNTPNKEEFCNIRKLADTLQVIRNEFGQPIKVTSGYRCKVLNGLVGGAANSDHLFGAAADIVTLSDKPTENKKLFDLIVKLANEGKIKCRQIIDEYQYNWIHISVNHSKNAMKDNQVLHIK